MADSTAQSPCGPPSSGGSPLLASFQRPTASRQLPAAKRFLPSASGPPLPAICQRPTASYHLRAAHRFIPTASGSPLPTICQRLTASYTLLAAHRFAPSPSGPPLTAIVQRPPVVKQAFMQRANQPQECQTAGVLLIYVMSVRAGVRCQHIYSQSGLPLKTLRSSVAMWFETS